MNYNSKISLTCVYIANSYVIALFLRDDNSFYINIVNMLMLTELAYACSYPIHGMLV